MHNARLARVKTMRSGAVHSWRFDLAKRCAAGGQRIRSRGRTDLRAGDGVGQMCLVRGVPFDRSSWRPLLGVWCAAHFGSRPSSVLFEGGSGQISSMTGSATVGRKYPAVVLVGT